MGDTAATPGWRSRRATTSGQFVRLRRRWARGCRSLKGRSPTARGSTGVTRSSSGVITTCACAPRVLFSVFCCSPVTRAEM
jgi:hypothetical protein